MVNDSRSGRWIGTIGLFVLLALSGCKQHSQKAAAPDSATSAKLTNHSGQPAAEKSTDKTSKPALTALAKQLGVKPIDKRTCPENAPIKAKISKKRGNIYQAPDSQTYAKVRPSICFANAATAEKAGFQAVKK